ncbi:hypothetical protein CQW23_33619 [Capsicum baccatum]|uniref:Uncharacterized protein n=1 Tax=Capsicum baccatum TaxID=33114 RepID=A0A2G2V1C6_CAPBA|nr:hypothetical protein CQW23_33619 [Capsicum baccatum]
MDPSPRIAGLGWRMLSITGTDKEFFKLVNSTVESTSPGPSLAELHRASSWLYICGSIFCDFNETRSKHYYFLIMKRFCRCSSISVDEICCTCAEGPLRTTSLPPRGARRASETFCAGSYRHTENTNCFILEVCSSIAIPLTFCSLLTELK